MKFVEADLQKKNNQSNNVFNLQNHIEDTMGVSIGGSDGGQRWGSVMGVSDGGQ